MLEKPNRKKVDKQDGSMPTNIEQLIQKYDLEKLWPYIEKIVENLNEINIEELIDFIDKYKNAFDINGNNVAIGQKYDTSVNAKLQVNGAMQVNGDTKISGKVLLTNNPVNFGGCRYITVVDSYVKLFTYTMSTNYKSTSIWFVLNDTQSTKEDILCNLYIYRGASSISIRRFSFINVLEGAFTTSRLVAVVTGSNTVEVYLKMIENDSPAITVLSQTKMFADKDNYGKIDMDCSTTVTSLPSGTSYSPTALIAGIKKLSSISNCGWGTNNDYLPDMTFIAYWNGRYSSTASNLTYCHQGEIQAKPTSLYDNSSGTSGTITLSETAANFNYLEVYYALTTDSGYSCSKVQSPNGKKANLQIVNGIATNNISIAGCTISISGTSVTFSAGKTIAIASGFTLNGFSNTNEIKIYKILGYR